MNLTTYGSACRDLEETLEVTGYLSEASRRSSKTEIRNRNIGERGHSGASFLGFFLGPAGASSLDQGGEVRKGCTEGHEWVLESVSGMYKNGMESG
jgi:hypothetical protein